MGKPIQHPQLVTMGQAVAGIARSQAISRLLDVGALEVEFAKISPALVRDTTRKGEDLVSYKVTPLGVALVEYAARELNLHSPDVREMVEDEIRNPPNPNPGTPGQQG